MNKHHQNVSHPFLISIRATWQFYSTNSREFKAENQSRALLETGFREVSETLRNSQKLLEILVKFIGI